jgi:hypothetical protein
MALARCLVDVVLVCRLRELDTIICRSLVFCRGYLEAMLINSLITCYVGL